MDDKTLHALTTIADKLGTTAEYLLKVLLKQAPISGVIHLLICVFFIFASIALTKFVYSKTTTKDKYPEWKDEGAFLAWVCVAVFFIYALSFFVFGIQEIVAAFLNPEYWALMQILKK